MSMCAAQAMNERGGDAIEQAFPPELLRRYEVHFAARKAQKELAIREVGAQHIGHIVKVKGMITRISDVKPLISVAAYTCDECGFEIYQQVKRRNFMPVSECPSAVCKACLRALHSGYRL